MNTITELAIAAARRDPLEPQSMADRAEHLADVVRYISENWPNVQILAARVDAHAPDGIHLYRAPQVVESLGNVSLSALQDELRLTAEYQGVKVYTLVKSWQP